MSKRRKIVVVSVLVLPHFAAVSSAKRDANVVPTAASVSPTAAKCRQSHSSYDVGLDSVGA